MALVHFYLHNESETHAVIRLQYRCEDGKDYVESMKERIKISHWKKKVQRMISSAKSAGSINKYLDQQQERAEQAIRNIRARGKRVTKQALTAELKGQVESFWEFFDSWLAPKPPGKSLMERMLRTNLKAIEAQEKIEIDFPSIDQNLADLLTDHMRNGGYNDSTIKTTFAVFNALLGKAKKKKVINDFERLETKAKGIDPGAVYTSPEEIKMMLAVAHAYHLPGNKIRVRSLRTSAYMYALGTQIGVRSIDFYFSKDNLIQENGELFFTLKNQKTSRSVLVPVSATAKMILNYFGWKHPRLSLETVRNAIPVVARFAGINEPCIYREMIGGKIVETVHPKHDLIGLHTWRRSWFTNLRRAGADVSDLMQVGGWSQLSTAQRYDRTTSKEAAREVGKKMR